jgi:hypothetical protein
MATDDSFESRMLAFRLSGAMSRLLNAVAAAACLLVVSRQTGQANQDAPDQSLRNATCPATAPLDPDMFPLDVPATLPWLTRVEEPLVSRGSLA